MLILTLDDCEELYKNLLKLEKEDQIFLLSIDLVMNEHRTAIHTYSDQAHSLIKIISKNFSLDNKYFLSPCLSHYQGFKTILSSFFPKED